MPIATIKNTTWTGVNPQPRELKLRARPCWLPRSRGVFLAAEMTLLIAALLHVIRGGNPPGILIIVVSCVFLFHISNLDRSLLSPKASWFLADFFKSIFLGVLASGALFYVFPWLSPGVSGILRGVLFASALPILLRPLVRHLLARKRLGEGVLIVGTGDLAEKLYQALANGKASSNGKETWNGSVLEFPSLLEFRESPEDGGLLVDCTRLTEIINRHRISRVIVAESDPAQRAEVGAALLDCRLRGLRVSDAVDFYERCSGKIWVEGLYPQWLVYTDGFDRSRPTVFLKRLLDVACAIILIAATLPLLAVIAIAIKIDSAGPVLFRQLRVGLHGRPFILYKFRSMRQDAESETGPVWAGERDNRVTRVGRLLRKFRLDEIPQAFNVLRGEMSLVGPRPERPYFVELLERKIPFYNVRHYVKPGITGWAQVIYRYGASIEDAYEKLQYDLYYVKHLSVRRDTQILLRTLRIVLFGRGR